MKTLLPLVLVLLCGLYVSSAHAATYYADPNGSDNNDGSQSSPFQTLQRGVNALQPGDTLLVHGGSYSSGFAAQTSGTAGAPITIRAVPGETPVITASGGDAINISDISWIIVDGLTNNGGAHGVRIQGNGAGNNQILNCEVAFGLDTGVSMQNGAHDNLIKNCRIHDNVQNNFNSRGKAASWGAGAIAAHQAPNNTFEDNYIYWNSGEGTIAFDAADGTTWRRNVIADNWSENLYMDGSKNCTVEDNLIYVTNEARNWSDTAAKPWDNNPEGIAGSVETYASPPSTRDSIGHHIRNNIVVTTGNGLSTFVEEGGHTFSGWVVTNNTFVNNALGVRVQGSTANNTFQDNIVFGGSPVVQWPSGGGDVFANNVYFGNSQDFVWGGSSGDFAFWQGASGDTNSHWMDPQFPDSSAIPPRLWSNPSLPAPAGIASLCTLVQPYQLQAGSPAKTASSTGGEVGAFGGSPDFGCGGGGDTTPPTVAITSPAAGTVTSSSLTVMGTASDNVGVTSVTVSCSPTCGSPAVTGTTSWSVTVSLQTGSNTVTAVAHDAANNNSQPASRTYTLSGATAALPPPVNLRLGP